VNHKSAGGLNRYCCLVVEDSEMSQ